MNLWQRFQQGLRRKPPRTPVRDAAPPPLTNDDEIESSVPEMSVEALLAALDQNQMPLMIDIREPYEWRLVRIPNARHLPMNDIPAQVASLPRDQRIVVICAHGSRSYSVAAWLIEQGYDAVSLAGGITQWARLGGVVEQGAPVA